MSSTSPNETQLTCRLINAFGPLADEVVNKLIQQDIHQIYDAKPTNYIIWFNPNESTALHDLESYISISIETLSKILVIYTLDRVGEEEKNSTIQSNILLDSAAKQGIDIRVVFTRGEWGTRLDSVPKSLLQQIAVELQQGKLIYIDKSSIYPFDTTQAVEKIMRFWFDRGHRGKTILVQGEAVPYSQITDQLMDHNNQLKNHLIATKWNEKTVPDNSETVTVPGNYEQYQKYLETLILPPPPVITASIPKPAPSITALKTQPVTTPQFQAVIIDEPPSIPTTSPVRPRQVQSPSSNSVKRTRNNRSFVPHILLGVAILLIATMLPYGIALFRLWQASRTTTETPTTTIHARQQLLDQSSSTMATIGDITQGLPPFSWFESRLSSLLIQSRITLLRAEAGQLLTQGIKSTVTATDGSPYDTFQQAKHVLDSIYLLQSTKIDTSLADRQWVNKARQIIDIFPQLIPPNKKIIVMIMLQNNLELRPSGGFIGAVALLTFDHGKLLTYDTRDIYDLDSNLKGVVTPPSELRTYLGETSWYFRDANWSPNYVESATMANWFLEKEWGNRADVIIGINLNTLKQILAAAPALTLPDGQVVSADNVFATAFNHQDVPSVKPDSTKQEFISLFLKPLIDQLATAPSVQTMKIADAFGLGLETGELAISASDPNVQTALYGNGWSGNPAQVTCAINLREPCSKDTLYVNEANVGINKTNFYLSRKIDHKITLSSQTAEHIHSITYTNSSPNEAWPAGMYKNYMRIMLPSGTTQISLSLDNKTLTESEYITTQTQNATLVSVFFEIKPQTSSQLSMSYQVPLDQNYQSYVFTLQKQPGISIDPLNLKINPPQNKALHASATLNPDNTFSGIFDRNLSFALGQ